MAQSVEHHLGKVEVPGSNPGNSSKRLHYATFFIVVMVQSNRRLGKDVSGNSRVALRVISLTRYDI